PRVGLADEDVQPADPVAPPDVVQPDPADGPTVDLDEVRVALLARPTLALGHVGERRRSLVVHEPPDLGVVLPALDQRVVTLLDRAEDDALAADQRPSSSSR